MLCNRALSRFDALGAFAIYCSTYTPPIARACPTLGEFALWLLGMRYWLLGMRQRCFGQVNRACPILPSGVNSVRQIRQYRLTPSDIRLPAVRQTSQRRRRPKSTADIIFGRKHCLPHWMQKNASTQGDFDLGGTD